MVPIRVRRQPPRFVFPKALGFEDARKIRRFETRDIVRRLGVLSPNRVFINNYPASTPPVIFNPSLLVEDEIVRVYARIVVGYYKYVSGIVELEIPIEDLFSGNININYYASRIVIAPSTKYDLWGAEDPRVYKIGESTYMTYTGRSINYFNPAVRIERTMPVTAIREELNERRWKKVFVHKLPDEYEEKMVSNKDAFLVSIDGRKYFFHRPHMIDENYYLLIGVEGRRDRTDELTEIVVNDNREIMRPLRGKELKLGWSTPPVVIGRNRVIALIHGVDNLIEAYRVFAAEIQFTKEGVVVAAVTPSYIMAPKESYEIFGDRPYTIFPCGLWRRDDKLLISYGAGDAMIGFGEIDLNDLIGLLDKGRIY